MLNLNLDPSIYANDAFAQEILANTAIIAAENKTDPVTISDKYVLLEPMVRANLATALVGPGGTGKSVAVALLAYKLKIPLIIFQATVDTRASSLIGRFSPNPNKGVNGDDREFSFEKGLLLKAYEQGYWFDCEEYLQFAPEQQSLLMKFLDGSPSFFVPETKEIVHRHQNFRFIGTGNPDYNGNKDKQKNESFLDRIKPTIYIPELAAKSIVSMNLQRYPKYAGTSFFKVCYDLNKALSVSAKTLLRKDLVFGTRGVNALCETLESLGPGVVIQDVFFLAVESSLGSAIAQVGGGCGCIEAIFKEATIKSHMNSLYQEYKKAMQPVAPSQNQTTQPPVQPTQAAMGDATPEGIYDAMRAAGVKLS